MPKLQVMNLKRGKHYTFSPVSLGILTMKRRIRRTIRRKLRNGKRTFKKRTSEQQVRNPKRRLESLEQVGEERVNWLDMPRDIMILIFSRLNTSDLLRYAQFVCSSWLHVAKDRQLFQSIILSPVRRNDISSSIELLKAAVDRSCGECMEISLEKAWCTLQVLLYVAHSSKSLKRLRLKDWDECELSGRGLVEVCKGAPVLEELELDTVCNVPKEVIKEICESCSHLKYFRFVPRKDPYPSYLVTVIARTMPQLRALHLSFTTITTQDLQAILDSCRLLENLELRHCFYFDLCAELVKQTVDRIRYVTLPSHKMKPASPPWRPEVKRLHYYYPSVKVSENPYAIMKRYGKST